MSLANLLAGRATTTTTKKATGLIVTDPELLAQAERWIAADEKFESAESALEVENITFKPALRAAWFTANSGRAKPESSLKMPTPTGTVSASFAAQWFPKTDLAAMLPATEIRQRCELKIAADKIDESKQEALVSAILAVVDELGCSEAITIKLASYPRETFATTRHSLFSVEQNERMELAGLGTRLALRR